MRLQEQKIILLRGAKKISQQVLADAIYTDVSRISTVERGLARYSDTQLEHIMRFFSIEHMPLSEFEVKVFYKMLYTMYRHIRDGRFIEAEALFEEMAKLINLEPCDDILPMLYRLFSVALMIYGRNNLDAAEKELEYISGKLDMMTDEQKYHYYFNMGALHIRRGNYEESLGFYQQALDISGSLDILEPKDIKRLYLNIASCYSYLEYPIRAILYLRDVSELHRDGGASMLDLHFDNLLALNYIRINEQDRAEKILKDCLIDARSIDSNYYCGLTLHNYGLLHKQAQDWDKAINYFKSAMEYYEKGSTWYLRAVNHTIICFAMKKNCSKARKLLNETKPLYNNDEVYRVIFKALDDFITIKSRISLYNQPVEYIETIALPYFEKTHDYYLAVDFYKLLESYYTDKNNKKSLVMSEAIRRIYERCFMGNERSGK
ncbi:MAG: hypothetical protein FWC92_06945 [Defluviitaleaceae bacterium]|nr:hypothetical protein [Defluviitaleaceae bacterium]